MYIHTALNQQQLLLVDLMNIQFIQANGEADSVCSKLNKNGVVDMVMSDDMDLLVTGTKILLRDYCLGNNRISVYDTDNILNTLEINYDFWVDFCILCGCDYCSNIPKIGYNTALSIIRNYSSIDEFINTQSKYKIPDGYKELFQKSYQLFTMYQDKLSIDSLHIHNSMINVPDCF